MKISPQLKQLTGSLLAAYLIISVGHPQSIDPSSLAPFWKIPSIKDAGTVDWKCYQCKDTHDSPLEENLFCNDVYANSCLNPDGTSKFQNEYQKNLGLLQRTLKESRDIAAKEMGFEDFNDALRSKIIDAGIPLPPKLTDYQINQLLQENSTDSKGEDIKYPDIDSCEGNTFSDSIGSSGFKGGSFGLGISNTTDKYSRKIKKFNDRKVELSIIDLPNFLSTEFSNTCRKLKDSPEEYPSELNPELVSKCKIFPKIRQEAIEIFRLENTPLYETKATAFVRKNLLPSPNKKINFADQLDPIEAENKKLKEQSEMICFDLTSYLNSASQKIASKFAADLSRSKPLIDNMIGTYYNNERREKAQKLFTYTKENIKTLLPKITTNAQKQKRISAGYEQMQMAWLMKPEAANYEKNASTGLMTLKANDESTNETAIAFSDNKLSYFTDINAFYTSQIMEGDEVAEADTVHMMPYFIKQLDENNYNFLAVLAHEAGHKIGPDVSRYNGHDMRSEWKNLMSCYKGSDSIGMIDSQKDEVIADYISAEILASYILQLPASERRAAISSAMSDLCLFNDANNCSYSLSTGNAHPENILRINGVYGANPRLREAIGCKDPGSKYRSCSL